MTVGPLEKIVVPNRRELHEWDVDIRRRKGCVGGLSDTFPTLWQLRSTDVSEMRKSLERHFSAEKLSIDSPLRKLGAPGFDERLSFYLLASKSNLGFFAGKFWVIELSYMIGDDQVFIGYVGDRKLWSALGQVNRVIWGGLTAKSSLPELLGSP